MTTAQLEADAAFDRQTADMTSYQGMPLIDKTLLRKFFTLGYVEGNTAGMKYARTLIAAAEESPA